MVDTPTGHPPDPDGSGWRRFFQSSAHRYDDEGFTRATEDELVFLAELLDLSPGSRVLDVGCGTGRHAVPIAAMGAEVTGLDQSPAMLERAEARASAAGVDVTWVEADARELPDHLGSFDVGLCLCEGAFCLVADGVEPLDHDQAILAGIHRVLRPGGRLVLTALNAGRLLTDWHQGQVAGEVDLMTLTETTHYPLEQGGTVTLREHYHLPEGLRTLAASVGLEVEAIWAGGAGDWRREAPTTDDYELLLVARRPQA
ncbi:MAG: class I SAM-dependent methyltransferase [Nitriliruptoraceae bacterium]